MKLCSSLMGTWLLNCPEVRARLPRSRSLGEGNSLCLGTGLFPLASLKPGVKLSWEPASEAIQPPQYGPVSAAAAVIDADPFLNSEKSVLFVWFF